jgi:hypothetical protein
MKFDENLDRETRVRIWDAGIRMGTSWTKFGDPRQIQQQIKARGTPQSLFYQKLMLSDVCGLLHDGDLIAMGFCVQPDISDGPIFLPPDTFSQQSDDDDILNDIVVASGWKYERVRVLERKALISIQNEVQEIASKQPPAVPADIEIKNPLGRPRVQEFIVETIGSLFQEGRLDNKSRKEQLEIIRVEVQMLQPHLFQKQSQPSNSALYKAMAVFKSGN